MTDSELGPTYDAYVLVHPETYPTLDPQVIHRAFRDTAGIHPRHGHINGLLTGFDERLAALIAAHANSATRRIIGDDGFIAEDGWDPDDGWYDPEATVLPGVPGAGWDVVLAGSQDLETEIPGLLPSGSRVLLAGFSRHDCVARVAKVLEADGCTVTLDESATLPLSDEALATWLGG